MKHVSIVLAMFIGFSFDFATNALTAWATIWGGASGWWWIMCIALSLGFTSEMYKIINAINNGDKIEW